MRNAAGLPSENTASVMCAVSVTLYTGGTLPTPVSENLPHSKSITAPNQSMKSVTFKPADSVESGHTRKERVNSRPFSTKINDLSFNV